MLYLYFTLKIMKLGDIQEKLLACFASMLEEYVLGVSCLFRGSELFLGYLLKQNRYEEITQSFFVLTDSLKRK